MTPPPETSASIDPTIVLAVFATLAGAAAIAAIVLAVRTRDPLPIVVCVGALVCALNEPIYDWLGKIVYAADNPMAYTAFERDIPVFLVVGYVPWVGLLPLLIARAMAAGISRARLHAIAFGSFLSVVVVETIGTEVEAWTYYGEPPLKYLGVAPQMAPVPIVCGFLLYAVGSRVTGWWRLAMVAIPTVSLPAVYASAGWPMYLALHSDVSKPVQYLAGAATLALCAAIVACATAAAQRWRESAPA